MNTLAPGIRCIKYNQYLAFTFDVSRNEWFLCPFIILRFMSSRFVYHINVLRSVCTRVDEWHKQKCFCIKRVGQIEVDTELNTF